MVPLFTLMVPELEPFTLMAEAPVPALFVTVPSLLKLCTPLLVKTWSSPVIFIVPEAPIPMVPLSRRKFPAAHVRAPLFVKVPPVFMKATPAVVLEEAAPDARTILLLRLPLCHSIPPVTLRNPAPLIVPEVKSNVPFIITSSPVPSLSVSVEVMVNVPPVPTIVWSVVMPLFTVTVWPVLMVITPSELEGATIAATKLVPLCRCQVDAALQLPDAALW